MVSNQSIRQESYQSFGERDKSFLSTCCRRRWCVEPCWSVRQLPRDTSPPSSVCRCDSSIRLPSLLLGYWPLDKCLGEHTGSRSKRQSPPHLADGFEQPPWRQNHARLVFFLNDAHLATTSVTWLFLLRNVSHPVTAYPVSAGDLSGCRPTPPLLVWPLELGLWMEALFHEPFEQKDCWTHLRTKWSSHSQHQIFWEGTESKT